MEKRSWREMENNIADVINEQDVICEKVKDFDTALICSSITNLSNHLIFYNVCLRDTWNNAVFKKFKRKKRLMFE